MSKKETEIIELVLAIAILFFLIYLIRKAFINKMKRPAKDFSVQQSTIDFLKEQEGYENIVYKDTAGKDTVGIGHLVLPKDNLKFGDKVSDSKIIEFAAKDMNAATDEIHRTVKIPINQNMFDALLSLVYNEGVGAIDKSLVLKLINSNAPKEEIGTAWLAWDYVAGKESEALENRRIREFELFMSNF